MQAAALAAADLLQGRPWPALQPFFVDVWAMSLRGELEGLFFAFCSLRFGTTLG